MNSGGRDDLSVSSKQTDCHTQIHAYPNFAPFLHKGFFYSIVLERGLVKKMTHEIVAEKLGKEGTEMDIKNYRRRK